MADRVKLSVGDVFEMTLDEKGNKGFGRIIINDKQIAFVELYESNPIIERTTSETIKPILSIWCVTKGFKTGYWSIIGNIPVTEIKMPNFRKTSAINGKIILLQGNKNFDEIREIGEITKEQIGDAQPYGVFGYKAVEIRLLHELKLKGFYL